MGSKNVKPGDLVVAHGRVGGPYNGKVLREATREDFWVVQTKHKVIIVHEDDLAIKDNHAADKN